MKRIFSFYGPNIDEEVLYAQRKIFAHSQIPLEQIFHNSKEFRHGEAINETLDFKKFDEVALFDVDSFCTSKDYLLQAFALARQGYLVGGAQNSNHCKGYPLDYVAPSFCVFSKLTWIQCRGSLGFLERSKRDTNDIPKGLKLFEDKESTYNPDECLADVGEEFTNICRKEKGEDFIEMIYPSNPGDSSWQYANKNLRFGRGTWYGKCVYHHFEIRNQGSESFVDLVNKLTSF